MDDGELKEIILNINHVYNTKFMTMCHKRRLRRIWEELICLETIALYIRWHDLKKIKIECITSSFLFLFNIFFTTVACLLALSHFFFHCLYLLLPLNLLRDWNEHSSQALQWLDVDTPYSISFFLLSWPVWKLNVLIS